MPIQNFAFAARQSADLVLPLGVPTAADANASEDEVVFLKVVSEKGEILSRKEEALDRVLTPIVAKHHDVNTSLINKNKANVEPFNNDEILVFDDDHMLIKPPLNIDVKERNSLEEQVHPPSSHGIIKDTNVVPQVKEGVKPSSSTKLSRVQPSKRKRKRGGVTTYKIHERFNPKSGTFANVSRPTHNKKRRKVQKKIAFEEQERNKYAHLKNSGAMFGTTNSIVYCSHTVSMRCGNCKCASI